MGRYDLIIIGAGPGGYVAAIHAAQKGMKVACIEQEKLGGTCLNVGCIPSKALLYSSESYNKLVKEGKKLGIEANSLTANLSQMMLRKDQIVTSLVDGIAFLFRKNKVDWIQGKGKLLSANQVEVDSSSGKQIIEASYIILASGSEPIPLPFLPFDEKRVLSSTGTLALKEIPKTMVIVGAGIIGLELGSVYNRLGTKIEVVEFMDRVTPTLDLDISKSIYQILKKEGMQFHLSSRVIEGKPISEGMTLTIEDEKKENRQITGEVVLVSIGRRPFSKGLGLEESGIKMNKKGEVIVNDMFQTSLPNVYAIGDLIDGPMLAHKASEEGMAVVDFLAGEKIHLNYLSIPNVMYTWPEVATVGMREEDAKEAGLNYRVGKVPFKANARARCNGDEEGFVKIIGEKNSGRLIGLHIIGPNASEMIGEGVFAIEKKMTVREVAYASHAHPTLSEAIKEAALAYIAQV